MIFDFLFKKTKKKPAAKKAPKKAKVKEEFIGRITHYFPKVRAGIIRLTKPLNLGDTIHIKGTTTDLTQKVTSLQIDRAPIKRGAKGKEVGFGCKKRVRRRDKVYKIRP
jgi:hypothetical protein